MISVDWTLARANTNDTTHTSSRVQIRRNRWLGVKLSPIVPASCLEERLSALGQNAHCDHQCVKSTGAFQLLRHKPGALGQGGQQTVQVWLSHTGAHLFCREWKLTKVVKIRDLGVMTFWWNSSTGNDFSKQKMELGPAGCFLFAIILHCLICSLTSKHLVFSLSSLKTFDSCSVVCL